MVGFTEASRYPDFFRSGYIFGLVSHTLYIAPMAGITVEQLFPKLHPLLKAFAAKYPEYTNGGGVPSLGELQVIRCSKADCMKPKKDYMHSHPCAWCEEHMPAVVDVCTPPAAAPTSPPPSIPSEPKKKAKKASLADVRVLSKKKKKAAPRHPSPPRHHAAPVKRRLTYDEEYVHDVNSTFFRTVHTRYQKDHRWLRTSAPDNLTISNNLKSIEVHLQQLKDQQDSTEENLLHKIALIGEREEERSFEMKEHINSIVDSVNRIDDTIDEIQQQITDVCKLVNDLLEKTK